MKILNLREVKQNIHNHSANKGQIHHWKQTLFHDIVHAFPACHGPIFPSYLNKKLLFFEFCFRSHNF